MRIWHRREQKYIEEQEYQKELLEFLYHTVPGRILLKTIVANPWFSEMNAWYERSPRSIKKITPFIQKYNIDLSECTRKSFKSFDDFFTRKRNYDTQANPKDMISIADARLLVRPITKDLMVRVKNNSYTLQELVGEQFDVSCYEGGTCLIYRLAMEDYHRYVFPDEGHVGKRVNIPGKLHTVRPVSAKSRAFAANHRICSRLHTKHFGELLQIEVGALLVGRIHNHKVSRFTRLKEKGYFAHGGSTILLLIEPDRVVIDEDIRSHSMQGTEVLVRIGETIGRGITKE